MTEQTFFVATDANGAEFVLYGTAGDTTRGTYDVVASRAVLDRQNQMLWRRVVAQLTGEWPECDVMVCDHEDRRHQGPCRTFLGITFGGGGPDAA